MTPEVVSRFIDLLSEHYVLLLSRFMEVYALCGAAIIVVRIDGFDESTRELPDCEIVSYMEWVEQLGNMAPTPAQAASWVQNCLQVMDEADLPLTLPVALVSKEFVTGVCLAKPEELSNVTLILPILSN